MSGKLDKLVAALILQIKRVYQAVNLSPRHQHSIEHLNGIKEDKVKNVEELIKSVISEIKLLDTSQELLKRIVKQYISEIEHLIYMLNSEVKVSYDIEDEINFYELYDLQR